MDKERSLRIDLSIHKAIIFACKKHDKQLRKSTDIPYISHIMEVMYILQKENCDEDVIIAGILHDTLEDTKTTENEICSIFGEKILSIVKSESENKDLSWIERKTITIEHLYSASIDVKLVCCADKLANIRSMYDDLINVGDKLWERFNAPKDKLKWYYEGILKSLSDIQDTRMYTELSQLIIKVFG